MLDDISVQQTADQWDIPKRRIQKLCEENKKAGAVRFRLHFLQSRRMRKHCLMRGKKE